MSKLQFRSDSLVARVCEFFLVNPDEELDRKTIAIKWNVTEQSVHTKLAPGVEAGVLVRGTNADEELVYKRGPKLEGEAPPSSGRSPLEEALRPRVASSHEFVDPAAVPIEEGVPVPGRPAKVRVDWGLLLSRMQPGQSAVLPANKRAAVGKACKAVKDAGQGEFLIKRLADKQRFRVWRTA